MIRVTDQLAKAAHEWPDRAAISCALGTLTWAQLYARCQAQAQALLDLGITHGDRVAWLGFNASTGVECYYAPALVGAACVPLNFRLSEQELQTCLADCTPMVLVCDAAHAELAVRLAATCPSIKSVWQAGGEPVAGAQPYNDVLSRAEQRETPLDDAQTGADDDLLILFYTGGTTGTPKGVMLSHTNIFTNAMGTAAAFGITAGETHYMTGPLFHTAGGSRVYISSLMGTHLVIRPNFDVVDLMQQVSTHRVNLLQFVPTMMAMMLDHPQFHKFDMTSLKTLTYGASPMPPELLRRAMAAFPGVRFGQAFGMTEASPILTILPPDDHAPDGPNAARLTSVGRAVPYVDMRIINDDETPCAQGEVGEVIARGPNIMLGYWNQPEQSATALRGGWYHTGDAGYLDADGYLFLTGRIKDMIISGGENVYPIEVENVISTHPAVAEVAVIGTPDPTWGERVHAVVSLHSDVDGAAIIDHARARLAHYKCPKQVSFHSGPLPLTAVNKIDKRALRALYNVAATAPETTQKEPS